MQSNNSWKIIVIPEPSQASWGDDMVLQDKSKEKVEKNWLPLEKRERSLRMDTGNCLIIGIIHLLKTI